MKPDPLWVKWANVISPCLQILGAVLMANALLRGLSRGRIELLWKSIFKPSEVKAYFGFTSGLSEEDKAKSVRGLVVIGIGFVIDFIVAMHGLLS